MPSTFNVQRTTLTRRPLQVGTPDNPGITAKFAARAAQMPADGFTLNPSIYMLPYRYSAAALNAMDIVRKSNLMRGNVYAVPAYAVSDQITRPDLPLQPYATLVTQLKMLEGAVILGFKYLEFDSETGVQKEPTNPMIQVIDVCTGVTIAQDYASADLFSLYNAGGFTRSEMPYVPLPQPLLVTGDGRVDVIVNNTQQRTVDTVPTLVFQLTIFVSEPAVLVKSVQDSSY